MGRGWGRDPEKMARGWSWARGRGKDRDLGKAGVRTGT